jgi:hypothetical protein
MIPWGQHRLFCGFLDSNWGILIADCEFSGHPFIDCRPKDVVNTRFSMKTEEELFHRPLAG